MPAAIYDAFISYEPKRSADAKAAALIQEALRRAQLTCWTYSLAPPGRDRFRSVVHGLRRSRCVLAIVSDSSLRSKWRTGELYMGHSDAAIVPVLLSIEPKKLPFGLANVTPIAYHPSRLPDIVAAVRAFRATSAQGRSRPNLSTSDFLASVGTWPPPSAAGPREGRAMLQEALEMLGQNPTLRQACTNYESMTSIAAALYEIDELIDSGGRREEWQALATLAQPFDPLITLNALLRAGTPEADITSAIGENIEAAAQNFLISPETSAEMLAEVLAQESALQAVGAPRGLPAATPSAPPATAPQPASSTGATPAATISRTPTGTEADAAPALLPQDDLAGVQQRHKLIWLTGVAWLCALALLLASAILDWSRDGPSQSSSAPGPSDRPLQSAPEPDAPKSAASLPQPNRVPTYCQSDLTCRFPRGYSFARVAQECYGHDKYWPAIWVVNAEAPAFATRDPRQVFDGEVFVLPRPCDG